MRQARYKALALLGALIALVSSAFAQDNLDPQLQVIGVDAGADQTADCGSVGGVFLNGAVTNGYTSEFPLVVLWIDTTTTETVATELVTLMNAPHQTTTYRLLVWNIFTGEWGEDFMTVVHDDQSAPVVDLLGFDTEYVYCGGTYTERGWTVSDNCDPDVEVQVTGSVDTNTIGTYVLTYTATDGAGNTSMTHRTVQVIFEWTGLKAPVDSNGSSIFKLGSTIPLKFELLGHCAGLTSLNATVTAAKITDGIAGTELVPVSTSAADTGNTFRYTGGQYVFNLSTKSFSEGTWELRVNLGDGLARTVLISIKK